MIDRARFDISLAGGRVLTLGPRPLVMGILNVTPDSFSESAHTIDTARAVDAALRIEAEGADLIDIGGESTRPGAEPVPADLERGRIMPVLEALQGRLAIPISVDTYKAAVARDAMQAGASMINDVSGLRFDPELASVAAATGAALVLMHSRGSATTLHAEAAYDGLTGEIAREMAESIEAAAAAGVPRSQVIVDPGVGFAKRAIHSYGVLARLPELILSIGRPILVGPSRKSFMRDALDGRPAPERDWGTAAAVTAAVLNGAHIVRVHAVGAMVQVVRVAEEIRRAV